MNIAAKVAVGALFVATVQGCASESAQNAETARAEEVRIISIGRSATCHFVAHVKGDSASPQDKDLYLVALGRVRVEAVEQSANAMVLRAYEIRSDGSGGMSAAVSVDIYKCNQQGG
jgi:hypothetical protein